MIDFLGRYLSWRAFALGLALALTGASVAGWVVTATNNFPGYVRSYLPIAPELQYYPTARQIAALVNERAGPDQIMVLVGGSSVFRGVSQRRSNLWTLALEKELGPPYRVLNLAMNGGGAVGMASQMTEMLTKTGRRAILVADALPGTWFPDSPNAYYRYFYYEAEARGYLYASPRRSAYLASAMDDARVALRLRAMGDTLLNYEELWQYLGACCGFTVYSPVLANDPWAPRGTMPDTEAPAPGFSMQALPADNDAIEMRIVRGYAAALVDCPAETRGLDIAFPDEIKNRIIIVPTGQAPFYANQLEPAEQEGLHRFYDTWSQCLAADGITPAAADRLLDDDDHYDRIHLREIGGAKLAAFLAPLIRSKAKELGYAQ